MGSPDLEKALLFGFWCSNSHAQNVQANGRFCFLARGSIFSKGALRAVGAMAFVAAALEAATCFDVKAVADSALRCAGLSLCCVCGSSAASTSAVQLEYQQEQEQRKRSMEHRQEISSLHCVAVQAATHSVEFYLSPRFFLKEMAIFTPPLAKFSPAARIINPPRLLGGAARPESVTLTVTIIHAWSGMVVDVPGVGFSVSTFIDKSGA